MSRLKVFAMHLLEVEGSLGYTELIDKEKKLTSAT